MELRKRALGTALGTVWGFAILLTTWWLLLWGSPGHTISKLGGLYIGYSYSWGGALIGFIWGFIDGFVTGFLFAWIYNGANKFYTKPKIAN